MRICPKCTSTYEGDLRFCPRDATVLLEKADHDRLGSAVGNYRLLEVLGRGGMGTVYRGEHVYIGKPVAVKILHGRFARHEDAVKRFLREARAASSINHPNIVDVTDFGPLSDGSVYFIMEFLDGESLERLIEREAPVPMHRAINILNQIASALIAAHEQGIIHRDLKPENIMLTQRPGRRELVRTRSGPDGAPHHLVEPEQHYDFVKVLDFGIAKVLEPEGMSSASMGQTVAGTIFGTPEYMSPEAARGDRVDHRSDVYSLGIIFYDMLTRQVPFTGDNPVEILAKHIQEPPMPPRQAAPDAEITEAAERLIMKALAKRPEQRHQGMAELRSELQECYGSVVYRRHAKKNPSLFAAGVAPRKKRLTEELDEWLAAHKSQLDEARHRLEAIVNNPALAHDLAAPVKTRPSQGPTDLDWDDLGEPRAGNLPDGPLLLTRKKE